MRGIEMSRLKINSKYLNIIENLFLFLFTAYAMMSTNTLTFGKPVIALVMWPSMLLGMLIIGYRVLNFRDYYKMPGLPFLILMLGSIGISTVLNYRYSLKGNLVFCIYWAFYFLVLYTIAQSKPREAVKHNFEMLSAFYIIYTTVNIIVSFYLMAINYSQKTFIEESNYEFCMGFVDGRLWGTFTNPNNAAAAAAIAVIMLLYFAFKTKKIVFKIADTLLILVQIAYIALSDSRTGAVFCGAALGIFVSAMLLCKWRDKSIWLKVTAVCMAVVISAAGFIMPRMLKDGYNLVSKTITENRIDNPGDQGDEDSSFDPPVIDRGYDLSDDVSNRRFDVWKSGVEIYKSSAKTLVFGTGFSGVADYAKDRLPDTYIVSNDYAVIRTLDNELVNILSAQGTVGIIITAALIIYLIVFIIRSFKNLRKEDMTFFCTAISVVAGASAAAMFGGVMFYKFSVVGIIFWLLLGDMIYLLKNKRQAEEDE